MRCFRARRISAWGMSLAAALVVAVSPGAAAPLAQQQQSKPAQGVSAADGATAQARYDSLFGAEDKAVAARNSARDDVAFATKLMESSRTLVDDPALRVLLLSRAAAFAAKAPTGYRIAAEALDQLQRADPANAATYRMQVIDLLRLQIHRDANSGERALAAQKLVALEFDQAESLDAGHHYAEAVEMLRDAISLAGRFRLPVSESARRRLDVFVARREAAAMLEGLKKRLAADPGDRQLRKQTLACAVLILDDPGAITSMASDFPDGNTPNLIRTAAKPEPELTEADCKALGAWYEQLARENTGAAHVNAYLLAIRYHERYLSLHEHQDADRLAEIETLLNLEKQAATGAHGIHTADRIVVWNQHNGYFNDHGTTAFDLSLASHGHVVFERKGLSLPWQAGKDTSLTVALPPLIFDMVRIDITAYRGLGGGLAEVEAFRGDENVALHADVKASSSFMPRELGPEKVVDGITSSATYGAGYWVLDTKSIGWIEIRLREPVPLP